uniref:Uncharacterized protein n=1 Tax=Anguilla anguilla TaxID=7936 RepID=A0A0E9S359_ANGAN
MASICYNITVTSNQHSTTRLRRKSKADWGKSPDSMAREIVSFSAVARLTQ